MPGNWPKGQIVGKGNGKDDETLVQSHWDGIAHPNLNLMACTASHI